MLPEKHCIAIKTSAGKFLGMGHIQRMYSLLWYLNEIKNIKTFLLSDVFPDPFPSELKKYFKENLDFSPELIIRDMRDSSTEEIDLLQNTAPVIVIDDNGSGRQTADYAIDILPNPAHETNKFDSGIFIYGYNFLSALLKLGNTSIIKNIDFALYPGNSADSEYIEFLKSLLPDNSSYAVLNGNNSYVKNNKRKSGIKESSYAEILLSSKAVISHFGITLYEAFIAECRTIAVNPTPYHSELSDLAGDYLQLANLGIYTDLNIKEAKASTAEIISMPLRGEVNPADVYAKAIEGLNNFCELLLRMNKSKDN